ncbi:DUF3348 family protein [Zoogloea sp.]|uniref:DUF3348 family protein n=1 Tax=Zoogloea sp. TaxID=49181 RepID=UPI0034592AD5
MPVSSMAREVSRAQFHSSRLIRVLEGLAVADIADSRQSFGERLAQWLDFKDAISLYSVLHGDLSDGASRSPAVGARSPQEELRRVRDSLIEAIRTDTQLDLHEAADGANLSSDVEGEFLPYHRAYLTHQRSMQSALGGLRAQVRAALAERSASGRRLAALDSVLEQSLAARERSLLALLPVLLRKHFEHLLLTRGSVIAEDSIQEAPFGGWLPGFCRDVQAVLIAELDLRLQPVFGLMDALGKGVTEQQ